MKTLLITVCTILLVLPGGFAQSKYTTTKGFVSFYSKAPVADVDARNAKVKVELTSDDEVTFDMAMKDFAFKNKKNGQRCQEKISGNRKIYKSRL